MVTAKEVSVQQFESPFNESDIDLDPVTLILQLDLDMVTVMNTIILTINFYVKVKSRMDRQTDTQRHTDRQYENITVPHTRAVNIYIFKTLTVLYLFGTICRVTFQLRTILT